MSYVQIDPDVSTLDGWFDATDLRRIADAMDKEADYPHWMFFYPVSQIGKCDSCESLLQPGDDRYTYGTKTYCTGCALKMNQTTQN